MRGILATLSGGFLGFVVSVAAAAPAAGVPETAGAAAPAAGMAGEDAGSPIQSGRSFRLDSEALGETRTLDVSLPDGYDAGTARYPVLVVLDGDFEREIAVATTRFYAAAAQLPSIIVVGVRNTDRMRDFTPKPVVGFDAPQEATSAGGADRFLSFLSDELLPYLDAKYRTSPMRVLVGHSLGGLFALYSLAQRPGLFTGYVVMEPSTWWNNGKEIADVQDALKRPAAARVRLMLVNALPLGADTTKWGGAGPMVRELSTKDETHASMALAGMMVGLRRLFADFLPSRWQPGTRPVAMLARYDSLASRVGYPVPIPQSAFSEVFRMSVDSRYFDDAEAVVDRMEKSLGESDATRSFRAKLGQGRARPAPAGFVPLEFPAQRPTAKEAAAFLGRWKAMDAPQEHDVEVRASGDTLVVHDRIAFPHGDSHDADDPVIQVTKDGTLEWGLPFFRGLAALLVLRGRIQEDGTMTVTRQPRGWLPHAPGPEMTMTERFRRVGP